MCLDLLLITICVVIVIDMSGIIDDVEAKLSKWLKCKVIIPKPWSCSFCMSHHISLVYLLCVGKFTLPLYALILLFAFMTNPIYYTLLFIRDLYNSLINKLYKVLHIE